MRHVFKPALPASSFAIVIAFVAGLVLAGDESIGADASLFFLILAPLVLFHLRRILASLQFFELTPEGVAVQGLLLRHRLPFGAIGRAHFSRLTGDLVLDGNRVRIAIPTTTAYFGDLQFAILTGVWAHQGVQRYEQVVDRQIQQRAEMIYVLKPSLGERVHAGYAMLAPLVWAGCLSGLAPSNLAPLLWAGGLLQSAINLHSLRHALNWYELRAEGLLIHQGWRKRWLPANEFLTSVVRNNDHGRSLELAFLKETVRIRFGIQMPAEELAGMLNQRWTIQPG